MFSPALQNKAAELTGKDAALFVPSGTMGNLASGIYGHSPLNHPFSDCFETFAVVITSHSCQKCPKKLGFTVLVSEAKLLIVLFLEASMSCKAVSASLRSATK